jgi:DNA polymerase I
MTHSKPNMGQVPSGKSEYGHECRECWIVAAGKKLVGADADALELRDLAGYMAIFDGGEYIKTVLEGDKSKGTDMHSVNCRALGMDPKQLIFGTETGRDVAKTWFYAFIYGSGDENLGYIVLRKWGAQAKKKGAALRKSFLENLPAMGKLVDSVKRKAKTVGHLKGLDGRRLTVRSMHAALNTLLQSAGAIQMKKALCLLDDSLQALGLIPGTHYEFVANVHDEWQIEVDDDKAERVGRMAVEAIRAAGIYFNFRCPLDGAYDIGNNWAETH